MHQFRVVICGGGVAGIEGLLRLRRLVGRSASVTLLCPNSDFDYLPLSVLEPFEHRSTRKFPIADIAADTAASWIPDTLRWVDRDARLVHTSGGKSLPYDALLLAPGGRQRPVDPHMDVFTASRGPSMYAGLLGEIDSGQLQTLAFVVPEGPSWPLPLYELALMTAGRNKDSARRVDISFVIPGLRPLEVFGGKASEAVADLLHRAGIDLHCSAVAEMPAGRRLVLTRSGIELHPDRTVTVPRLTGPDVQGIPGDPIHRFLRIDEHCRVLGSDGHIFAAGDATDYPVKHGGLSAQQADTAADGIAHLAGQGPPSEPLHPVVRAMLVDGKRPLYLFAHVIAGRGWNAEVYERPPWDPNEKIVATELGSYLPTLLTRDSSPPVSDS